MAYSGNRIGLVVFLIELVCQQGLFGLDTALSAGRLSWQLNVPRSRSGPYWLVRPGPSGEHVALLPLGTHASLSVLFARNEVASNRALCRPSAWKQAGIYGLEFVGGTTGTALATVIPFVMTNTAFEQSDKRYALAAFSTYAVSSAFASAAGTYFIGKMFGQHGSYWHALAGGAVGGLCGSMSLFSAAFSGGREALLPVGLLLPQTCSVIIYNAWRRHGTE